MAGEHTPKAAGFFILVAHMASAKAKAIARRVVICNISLG